MKIEYTIQKRPQTSTNTLPAIYEGVMTCSGSEKEIKAFFETAIGAYASPPPKWMKPNWIEIDRTRS